MDGSTPQSRRALLNQGPQGHMQRLDPSMCTQIAPEVRNIKDLCLLMGTEAVLAGGQLGL